MLMYNINWEDCVFLVDLLLCICMPLDGSHCTQGRGESWGLGTEHLQLLVFCLWFSTRHELASIGNALWAPQSCPLYGPIFTGQSHTYWLVKYSCIAAVAWYHEGTFDLRLDGGRISRVEQPLPVRVLYALTCCQSTRLLLRMTHVGHGFAFGQQVHKNGRLLCD
jgi:hypothetical protein